MIAEILGRQGKNAPLAAMLHPEPDAEGHEPEQRVVFSGVSWQQYLEFDKALGDDRPGPRLYYLDGELEIMTTSNEHERIRKWIGDFLAIHFEETEIEIMPRGQATMRILKEAGAEPDESYCIGEEGEWPDLVLEIALTTGVKKLEIYRRFQVPEVWFWRRGKLDIRVLREDHSGYDEASSSRLLPDLDLALLERCVAIRNWQEARRTFRAGIA